MISERLELNKALFRVQEVHSTVGKTACQTDEHGESTLSHRGQHEPYLDGSWRRGCWVCGRVWAGGLTRALCASEEVLMAHCLILPECSLTSRWPSEGMQSTYRLYSSSAPCSCAGRWPQPHAVNTRVLSTEEELDPWPPVLTDQQGWPSWGWVERQRNGPWGLWAGALRFQPGSPRMHGGPEPVTPCCL